MDDPQFVAPNDEPRYTSVDMWEAWADGARWITDRAEIVDGELHIPPDTPGVEGWDYAEAFGSWIEDYDTERQGDA